MIAVPCIGQKLQGKLNFPDKQTDRHADNWTDRWRGLKQYVDCRLMWGHKTFPNLYVL